MISRPSNHLQITRTRVGLLFGTISGKTRLPHNLEQAELINFTDIILDNYTLRRAIETERDSESFGVMIKIVQSYGRR